MTSRPQYPMDSGLTVFGPQDDGPGGHEGADPGARRSARPGAGGPR